MIGKRITTSLLRSPFHDIVGQNKMILTYTDLKKNKPNSIPVDYYQVAERRLLVFTARETPWWENLREGVDVEMNIRRDNFSGNAQIIEDVKSVSQVIQLVLLGAPEEAEYFNLRLDDRRMPVPSDVTKIAYDWVVVYIKLYRVLQLVDGELVETNRLDKA
jgi:hypothetical protein